MKFSKKTAVWAALVIFLILLIDQAVKIWVKTHMTLAESIEVTSWFKIYFTENPGMAFGWELFDKLFLTIFRLIASGVLAYYLWQLIKKGYRTGYILCVSLIFAGAVGNIIDCLFYGVFFSESTYVQVASFLPGGGGYGSFLHGKVVDMLYFPLIKTTWPAWVPFYGGESFIFFRPVFNIADSAISVGIALLLLFYRKDLSESLEKKEVDE